MELESIPGWAAVALLAIIGWFVRRNIASQDAATNAAATRIEELEIQFGDFAQWKERVMKAERDIKEHNDLCNKIPKELLAERIETLCDKFEEFKVSSAEFRTEMREEIKDGREERRQISSALQQIIGKL